MKKMKSLTALVRPIVAALAVAGLAGGLLAGCEDAAGKAAEAPAAAGGPPVSAAVVLEKSIAETQEFSGRLEAIDHVEIRSRVSGFITQVNFKPGSQVKKGDVLFVVDPRPYQAEADRAQAAAASARAKADLARLELTRAERLLADKAIAQREFDERAASQKELDANARAAQAQYESAKLNLAYTRVTSPIDGRVSKAEITLGNLVDGSAVLTSVVSLERIYASFDGDEETYLRVGAQSHKGEPVVVKVGLANEEGFPHEGKLEFVDNQLDARTGSVRMRATFANTDGTLVPGLFARVQLGGGSAQSKAILINDRAVGTDQNRKFVFVVGKDNKAEYRAVTLGPTVDGMRVVRSGLKADEKIVVNGLQRVRPGAPITPQMVPMTSDVAAAGAKSEDKKDAKVAAL
ncbi:efflux RND transporter periplasmic adaptor subunit [Pseudoduganella buxea]|uniref:Efflux RND transporter periplasmic adaptor subunit n=1 Tax=Pseudoduganella buxea TaxID=1949069 RepID=A0A6I3T299_9BURK|nr:efflux RND transporter periplasmic adaptor subunit [Pseudoduganella buxea]MTV54876.1 efflux RND transporter periplasmic adaptor subunit [Pseudoduganella buxea]GGC21159.1 MexE family multidrug efflux RND transporter periplasmic adaptor subunit [Pseudoduganella buxea]